MSNTIKLKKAYDDGTIKVEILKNPPAWHLWVRPAANILPVNNDGKILIMHEFKAVTKKWIWGFPGGMIEKGETASQAAIRECEEELGLKPMKIKKICEVKTDFPDTMVAYYLGFNLVKTEKKDWEKIGKVKEVSLKELFELAIKRKIHDPRMVVAVLSLYEKIKKGRIKLCKMFPIIKK